MKVFPAWMYGDPADAAERLENIGLRAEERARVRELKRLEERERARGCQIESRQEIERALNGYAAYPKAGSREDASARPDHISPQAQAYDEQLRPTDSPFRGPVPKRPIVRLTKRARIQSLMRAVMEEQK